MQCAINGKRTKPMQHKTILINVYCVRKSNLIAKMCVKNISIEYLPKKEIVLYNNGFCTCERAIQTSGMNKNDSRTKLQIDSIANTVKVINNELYLLFFSHTYTKIPEINIGIREIACVKS